MVRRSTTVHIVILAAALALTAMPGPAFPDPPASREQALAALHGMDTATRAEAVLWIVNNGNMNDTPLLHERLHDESPFVRSYAEQGLWLLWSRSGDAEIDTLMDQGLALMQAGQHGKSIALLSQVTRRKPGFAEGWNRRATAYYHAGQYRKSIADVEKTLRLNPQHFGALSGNGLNYSRLGEHARALEYWRRALVVNPNLAGIKLQIRQTEELLKERRARSI